MMKDSALLWTSTDLAKAVNGDAPARTFAASGISIDSRSVQPGDFFIALRGPHFDGHTYVHDALSKGAVGALVHQVSDKSIATGMTDRLLVVEDTMTGLDDIARGARARADAKVVGITGSAGKTGTRAMMQTALSAFGEVHATEGNLNNEIGLPLSLSRMPADTTFGVFEMGMSATGEIDTLSRMARPHVAIITTVAAAHLEFFDSVADIARAKAEIMNGVEPGGTVILPRDNDHYPLLAELAAKRPDIAVLTFGEHANADIRLVTAAPGPMGQTVKIASPQGDIAFILPWLGRHHAVNALAVAAALIALGQPAEEGMSKLANLAPIDGRGTCMEIEMGAGLGWIVDESYNANPASVCAAIRSALDLKSVLGAKRLIVVLGDMLELGAKEDALHAELAPLIAQQSDIAQVHTTGRRMNHLHLALPPRQRGLHAPDASILAQTVGAYLHAGDLVMVKGSAGSRMGAVVRRLTESAGTKKPEELGHAV